MKNPVLIIIAVSVIVLGYFIFTPKSSPKVEPLVNQNPSINMDTQEPSRYVEYSKAALDKAADERRVLFFYANWCSTCAPANASFEKNMSKIPADLTLIRINYNDTETDEEEKELAKKYEITYQHTFVQIDKDGKEIAKWNGGQINELLANIK